MKTGFAIAMLAVASAVLPAAAQADACSATDGASLTTGLADINCSFITLAAGTYTSASGFTAPTRSVSIAGPGSSSTNITRSGAGDVFTVASGATLTLSGLTLGGATDGAGLSVTGTGVASLNNSLVGVNTTTGNGAGINFSGATLNVANTVITANSSAGDGGGFENSGIGTATFHEVLFTENSSLGSGGAADVSGALGTTNFKNVTLNANLANADGGAVRSGTATATTNLNNVTIAGNTADADNTGGGDGGGISNGGGTVTVANSILANNAATGGGAPDCDSAVASPLTRIGYELIRSATGCTFGGTGDLAAGYQTGVDPLLGPLDTNSAFTLPTMALLVGSPAVNTGNPATPTGSSGTCEVIDQRTRPRSAGALPCDLGAYEAQPDVCHTVFRAIGIGETTPITLDCAGDPFVYSIVSPPAHGSLSGFNAMTGDVTYTPNAGFSGTDSFTFAAVNGPLSSGPWSVTFSIAGPPGSTPDQPGIPEPGFKLKKALKRCKKVPKGPKRTKCIKKAKKRAKSV